MREKEINISKKYNTMKVLCVEDNEDDFGLIKRIVQKKYPHCKMHRVETKLDYIDQIKTKEPTIILSDYVLPEFSGFEALQLSDEMQLKCPFVFITGAISKELASETLVNGVSGFVLKNNLNELPELMEKLLVDTDWNSPKLAKVAESVVKRYEKNQVLLKRIKKYLEESGLDS